MSMTIDGEEIVDRYEIWSVRQKSSDGAEREIACPDGEVEARSMQAGFGGVVWVRKGFVTEGHPAEDISDEELMELQP